jgi:hypothetical protein
MSMGPHEAQLFIDRGAGIGLSRDAVLELEIEPNRDHLE